MRIEHIAIWSPDMERLKDFYIKYFGAVSNEIYKNTRTGFRSYFLSFKEGPRLEIMYREDVLPLDETDQEYMGYAHIAMNVGSKIEVEKLTHRLKEDGYNVVGEARTTGDGYFESVVLDPDGNRIEITC